MKTLELFKTYPKTAIVIKQWYLDKLLEELKDPSLPEDFKEHVREMGVSDETLARMVQTSPRSLFDLFDENHVFIEIFLYPNYTFGYKIEQYEPITSFITRKEAETQAIEESFKLLNDKL